MKPDPASLENTSPEVVFQAHRGRLLGLAYRMLGSRADAEDIVQESWLRLAASKADVRDPGAYLVTVATRLCLDQLKSARVRRESYVGPWLPEPVLAAGDLSPGTATELADDLSFALLLTLETLTPPERAAFLLHDVFDLSYADIARTLEKSEAACRQLAARARKAVKGAGSDRGAGRGADQGAARPVPAETHRTLIQRFFETLETGDMDGLKSLLRDDAVLHSDGGGVRTAALNLIHGADKVARFFLGIARKAGAQSMSIRLVPATLNGRPGMLIYIDGELDQSFSIDVADDRISRIYTVRNPEKLARLATSG